MSGFNFNLENFLLGLATGWGSALALYSARNLINAARASVSERASSAQEFAQRSADKRYLGDLVKYIQHQHLAGKYVPLTDMLIEPRFIPMPAFVGPKDDDVVRTVFHVVPTVSDHPYLQATYNIPTLSIDELDNADRAIALLGEQGSGRTTALFAIALWSLGEVDFTPPPDAVQQRLDEEEMNLLNDEDRAKRIRERVGMEELARQAVTNGEDDKSSVVRSLLPFRQLTPIYVHLGNISTNLREYGRRVDPAEPLLRAVQHYVTRVTRQTFPRNLYERMNEGKALLLLDGFDDLPVEQQAITLNWIKALVNTYQENFFIVSGPSSGYGSMVDAGLTPVMLRPWNDTDIKTCVDKWTSNWSQLTTSRRRGQQTFEEDGVEMVTADSRGRTVFEVTAKVWRSLADAENNTDIEAWMHNLISHYLPDRSIDDLLPDLQLAALAQIESGFITPITLEHLAQGQPLPAPSVLDEREPAEPDNVYYKADEDNSFLDDTDDGFFDAFFEATADDDNPFEDVEEVFDEDDKPARQEEEKAEKHYVRLVNSLVQSGLLVPYRGDKYQFIHPSIADYLAGRSLANVSANRLIERAEQPNWRRAMAYGATFADMTPVVDAKLNAPNDVLLTNLTDITRWIVYTDGKVRWRAPILQQLGNLFVAEDQFLAIRERIAAALVGSRDKGALVIFRQALNHPNPGVRRLACLGVGALRGETLIDDLLPNLDNADHPDVVTAAALALGAIGTEEAYEEMIVALTSGSESLRQAIAESFAAIPEEGYPVLYDAIRHEDMMLRRAAVFGLKRINTPWALLTLYQTIMEDQQWYVRSAAEIAFQELNLRDRAGGVQRYPELANIPWLQEWMLASIQAAGNGGAPADGEPQEPPSPHSMLLQAIDKGTPEQQWLAVSSIGQLGLIEYTTLLYSSLQHSDPMIREATVKSLVDIQSYLGQPLPSPIQSSGRGPV